MTRTLSALAASGALVIGVGLGGLARPAEAHACGGCFGPTETVTVVTGHRMAVALSSTETTLWDQIEYAGDPEDFVWVLPIQGEVLVELADNAFFEALDQATQVNLQGTFPPLQSFCPDPCFGYGAPGYGADGGAGADGGGVTVYGEAIVGPYETATIGLDDPSALVTWLQDHGYAVPDTILPTIAHYVDQHLNFAVLRLAPNAGVNQMQPVRVTTPGLMPVFPLRMVAAGVVEKVGLELYIIAEGRWGAANFAVGEIDPYQLVYDWDTGRFNYGDVFDAKLAELGGRAWIAEYAQPRDAFEYWLSGYASTSDDGSVHTAADDYAIATRHLTAPYLTKLRTDLAASFLDEDFVLSADTGADISNYISVANEIHRPPAPECPATPTTCEGPTGPGPRGTVGVASPGFGAMRGRSGHGLCSVESGTTKGSLFFAGAFAAALGAYVARRSRRR